MKPFLIIAAVLIAALRPFMPLHSASLQGSYEAMAQIAIGSLFGA